MYHKLVLELLLHKNHYDEALDTFSINIQYFRDENDFLKMINKARDSRRFEDIAKISKRWLKINPTNTSAHKISFSNYVELADFSSADYHLKYLFEKYNEKNNKSWKYWHLGFHSLMMGQLFITMTYVGKNYLQIKNKN